LLQSIKRFRLDHVASTPNREYQRTVESGQLRGLETAGLALAQVDSYDRLTVAVLVNERDRVAPQVQAPGQCVEVRPRLGRYQRGHVELDRGPLDVVP
jgi:hypothetical protein